ncbi:alpha-ketoglutarate-dependent taurine dioxygenase [Mycobacteroides chelonae]|nr:alpha-ketoglutarate-dependent taurine dioxygenase [Mycobacteroides chelonae]
MNLGGAANGWHTDLTFVDRIPKASVLRPVALSSCGGATTWASGGASAERRAAYYTEFTSSLYETLHPVVRVHPETGERSLLLGQFVENFQGLRGSEFAALCELSPPDLSGDAARRCPRSRGSAVVGASQGHDQGAVGIAPHRMAWPRCLGA